VRLYRRIALSFIILTLILLGVVLATTVSRATVTVVAKEVPVRASVKANLAADTKTSETVRGAIIASTVEGSSVAKPAGKGTTQNAPATGTVLLVNKRSAAQTLVATTRLLSKDGVLFRLKDRVVIPANGELKDVAVYADQAGPSGEIGPTNFTIPGLNEAAQRQVYAFSEKPMTGGVTSIRAVTQGDIDAAVTALKDSLAKQAQDSLTATMKDKGLSGVSSNTVEISRTVSAKAGDAVDSFTVSLKLTVNAVLYDKEKFKNLGEAGLKANVPTDLDLRGSDEDTVTPIVDVADVKAQTATLSGTFTGTGVMNAQSSILAKDRLVGLDAGTVASYLKSFDSVQDASVSFSPFWVRHVPRNQDHIEIIVK
jgi:hypothetical protein